MSDALSWKGRFDSIRLGLDSGLGFGLSDRRGGAITGFLWG